VTRRVGLGLPQSYGVGLSPIGIGLSPIGIRLAAVVDRVASGDRLSKDVS
jgi:hypothetical protein